MKKIVTLLCIGMALGMSACTDEAAEQPAAENQLPKLKVWTVPATPEVVAEYRKPIKDDLNKGNFEVLISTTDSTASTGRFAIQLNYGGNKNTVEKTFPKWYEQNVVQPMVKNIDSLAYGAVIGFDPGDGSFKELYEVRVDNKEIKFQQTKMYGTLVD